LLYCSVCRPRRERGVQAQTRDWVGEAFQFQFSDF
jgi:hypothetical protein